MDRKRKEDHFLKGTRQVKHEAEKSLFLNKPKFFLKENFAFCLE
jgi:hypothetical protein